MGWKLGSQLVLLLRSDWIPRVLTASVDQLNDQSINDWIIERWGLVVGSRLIVACLQRVQLILGPFPDHCFMIVMRWADFLHHAPIPWRFCFATGLEAMEPTDHGLKPLKPQAKISPYSLKSIGIGILSQKWKKLIAIDASICSYHQNQTILFLRITFQ